MTTDLVTTSSRVVDDDDIRAYAGLYVLKKLDLEPRDGGMIFPIALPSELTPLDEIFHEQAVAGHVEIHRRKERWQLTKAGIAYLATLIDEAEALIEEFDEDELPDVVAELRSRNLDPLRARFLWGWYQDEFDDIVVFQQRRGIEPIEPDWAAFVTSEAFYNNLALDLADEDQAN